MAKDTAGTTDDPEPLNDEPCRLEFRTLLNLTTRTELGRHKFLAEQRGAIAMVDAQIAAAIFVFGVAIVGTAQVSSPAKMNLISRFL